MLLDPLSPAYLVQLGDVLESVGRVLPLLVTAYRTGAGIPYADHHVADVAARLNRPLYATQLVQSGCPRSRTARRLLGDRAVVIMRPNTLRGYAADAGLSRSAVLPIEHEMFRFYRLEA